MRTPHTEYFGLYVASTPPAPTLNGTELVPVVISGITNNTTTQAIANLAPVGYPRLSASLEQTGESVPIGPLILVPTPVTPDTILLIAVCLTQVAPAVIGSTITLTITFTDVNNIAQTNTITIDGDAATTICTTIVIAVLAGTVPTYAITGTLSPPTVTYNVNCYDLGPANS